MIKTSQTAAATAARIGAGGSGQAINNPNARGYADLSNGIEIPDCPEVFTSAEMAKLYEERIWWLLHSYNKQKISRLSARDATTALSIFTEKRSLLRGEPTQIVRSERGELDKAMELLIAESRKRKLARGVAPEVLEGQFKQIAPNADSQPTDDK